MPAHIAIGNDSFREIRENNLEYVDKTKLIQEILDDIGTKVLLLPRPRRFGKTVNMTMLETFLARSPEDTSHLFEGLHIWEAGDAYREHFQRYPTLLLSFKNIKPASESEWESILDQLLSELFSAHTAELELEVLAPIERQELQQLIDKKANSALKQVALLKLSAWLERAHGERVLILVDEYDTPIHAAWRNQCYEPVVHFFRAFFGAALKGNPHLFKAVLTGILRVSKESIFSDLNNILVGTILDKEFSDAFGFTEAEVKALCRRQGQLDQIQTIQTWYNGYRFGGRVMYNPWSVLNFLWRADKTPQAYWVTSSSNTLIKELLSKHALEVHESFQTLLQGGVIQRKIEPNVVFPELTYRHDTLFTLLLFSGYLKAEQVPTGPLEEALWALSIPNLEVRGVFQSTFQQWIETALGGSGTHTQQLVNAMLRGDEERFEAYLSQLASRVLSYHDGAYFDPEALYHGLMLGLCATLEPQYRVRSNRESGKGRPDLMIQPTRAGLPGAVLELKVANRRRTLEQALALGVDQLQTQAYDAELEAMNAAPIQRWAVAFDGKTVCVERVEKVDALK